MRTKLFAGVAFAALLIPASAYAQSTGTIDFEEGSEEIVVTGTRTQNGVNGIVVPDTTKTRGVLNQEFIQRQAPGQSVNDLINQLPGVSYTNNDPFGSSGGSLNIRGFEGSRISQTFDGIPLNDSGNYAIYGNQQLDPELIEQVNVNMGTTDVDSPTAGATGSTVNYRTRNPSEDFGVRLIGSVGDFDFFRIFGLVDTGTFTSFGTRAWLSASSARNHSPFNDRAQVEKQQYNAKIYQPLGDGGDFIAIAGHWNENRNNFQGSVPLRTDTGVLTGSRVVGPNTNNRFPITNDEREYSVPLCQITNTARPGVADTANSCGSVFDERFNPSNTGNVRINSRFTLAEGLVFAADPYYQYTKANGGGTTVGQEVRRDVNPAGGAANCNTAANSATVSCQVGYIGGTPYFGRDLNGDGDLLDTVRLLTPSQTQTHRIGVISSLRYTVSPGQTVRVAYTYDRARHRQTGETGFLQYNGQPFDVFPVNDPVLDVNGRALQKRDRLSFAILHQFAAQYNGEFFDGTFRVDAGISVKFLRRNLNNYCATSSAAGFIECFGSDSAAQAAWLAANPTQTVPYAAGVEGATCPANPTPSTNCTFPTQGPQQRIVDYKRALPNIGYVADITDKLSLYGNFSQSIQVPGTDNLYNSFYYPVTADQANPKPETTDNLETGLRYRSSKVQAQVAAWYTNYKNRLASSYDAELDKTVYRNLGKVKRFGFDGTIAYRPINELSVYAFGSYLDSEIQDDVVAGRTAAGAAIYAPTKGKRESNAPVYTFGGGAQADLGFADFGFNVKRTGPRYIYDTNEPVRQIVSGNVIQVFGAKVPAYTLVDFNARIPLGWAGLNDKTYFQLNVLNAFDELWVSSLNSGNGALNQGPTFSGTGAITGYGNAPNSQIGYPRTFMGSLVVGF
ncbi:TonB-dependent receptor [Sphingomonas sp. Root241]|uniref:TonB-dependent receptor n=1 Tax=Sphingomonas sp. Root241 TaxID=1736501 RepID=UPI0006FFC6A9|nr:TonB-dependent receptor [Sphingomonas sp. Root241]KRC81143.1 TonB-dependent receptor [Sphingomonas sp. Root241]